MSDSILLKLIQKDASLSLQQIAEHTHMSQSTVWRKLQDFEKEGLIRGRVTLLDPEKLDLKICVYANATLTSHSEEAVEKFQKLVNQHPEIVECYSLAGNYDYIMKIWVKDVAAYEEFIRRYVLRNDAVASVNSSFVLRDLKNTTELPLS